MATLFRNQRIFIIAAENRSVINSLLESDLGPDTFSIPLINNTGVITHYCCSGNFSDGQMGFIRRSISGINGTEFTRGITDAIIRSNLSRRPDRQR